MDHFINSLLTVFIFALYLCLMFIAFFVVVVESMSKFGKNLIYGMRRRRKNKEHVSDK